MTSDYDVLLLFSVRKSLTITIIIIIIINNMKSLTICRHRIFLIAYLNINIIIVTVLGLGPWYCFILYKFIFNLEIHCVGPSESYAPLAKCSLTRNRLVLNI
jgi:hypothetical protein